MTHPSADGGLALLVMSLHYPMDMGSRRHDSSAGVTHADGGMTESDRRE